MPDRAKAAREWFARLRRWPAGGRIEHRLATGLAIAGIVVLSLILTNRVALYGGDLSDYSNRLYLLSAIVQALAAILALLVSLTLVATQLAAQAYSPRVVRLRLRDPWLWGAVVLYLFAIMWAMAVHGAIYLPIPRNADIALLLAGAALLSLIPFTIATMRSLDPTCIARTFAARGEDAALDDMMRKAVNDALMSVLTDGLAALVAQTTKILDVSPDTPQAKAEIATHAGARFRSIGRHACQRQNADALEAVQAALGSLVKYCTERQWRQAANTLNGVAAELEDYSLSCFGGGDEKD